MVVLAGFVINCIPRAKIVQDFAISFLEGTTVLISFRG